MADPFDTIIAGVFAKVREAERATSERRGQLTLNGLIAALEALPPHAPCGLSEPDSYRGFYDQLAFENDAKWNVADALEAARGALGQMFTGYKGGEYWMTGNTMVWLAPYGSCGDRIVGVALDEGGHAVIQTVPYDDD